MATTSALSPTSARGTARMSTALRRRRPMRMDPTQGAIHGRGRSRRTAVIDIDSFARAGGRLAVDDLDLEAAFADRPLDDATLRCLQYMHDIESHTVCYLR